MNTVGIDQLITQQAQNSMSTNGAMAKDDFLKMLTMQLKHQDPMNPMSNDQFASQLAQFSSLEALNNINDNIQTEIMMSQSMNNSFMINMIGKDVKSYGNMLEVTENGATIGFELYGNADTLTIRIFDDTGKEIHAFNETAMKAGDRSVSWNGMTKDGIKAMPGTYTFSVEAQTKDGVNVPVDTMNNGLVTGVSYIGGMPYLVVNGSYVNLGDIVSVNVAEKEN